MIRDELESREEEIIRTLSLLPKSFILVGGYAVSALSSHRFSVDCDIVTAEREMPIIESILKKAGYVKSKSAKIGKEYRGSVDIYVKRVRTGSVSVDIFINSMTARETGASWSYEYIKDNSTEVIVSGIGGSATVHAPTKDLIVAIKIHAARDSDMRDIVMLSEGVDWTLVGKHVARGDRDKLLEQITKIIAGIEDEQFDSSLRAAFELRRNIKPLVSSCRRGLVKLREQLSKDGTVRRGKDHERDRKGDSVQARQGE